MSYENQNFISVKVEHVASLLRDYNTFEYKAFAEHLDKVAQVLFQIELSITHRKYKGDDDIAILAFLGANNVVEFAKNDVSNTIDSQIQQLNRLKSQING